jgi:hypothetical protein
MSLAPAFRYMNAAEVAALIKAAPSGAGKSWAVIDVRDSDFAVRRTVPNPSLTCLLAGLLAPSVPAAATLSRSCHTR